MNILLISEQNNNLVGGTVSYQKSVISVLSNSEEHKIFFIYPTNITEKYTEREVTYIGIGVDLHMDKWSETSFGWKKRFDFAAKVNQYLYENVLSEKIQVIHILLGWVVIEKINYSFLHKLGVKILATMHNIPPQECDTSWSGDLLTEYVKNKIFHYVRGILSYYRIRQSSLDLIIVPSLPVRKRLDRIMKNVNRSVKIETVAHGTLIRNLISNRSNDNKILILTVGGIVPHKNQLIIPQIAKLLQSKYNNFTWNIVGPVRNERYKKAIEKEILLNKMSNHVFLLENVSDSKLCDLYSDSNLYVHTSFEEGFCFTALDAVAYSLPIVAVSGVGELDEIIRRSYGISVKNDVPSFFYAIEQLIARKNKSVNYEDFISFYSWEKVGAELNQIYKNIINVN